MTASAKRVRISDDAGSNWYTLPGNGAELNGEAASLNDTVFGQSFESMQPGLINWNISSKAFYKGFAGYVATLKKGGTPTTMTGEACSLVSGKTYKITSASKQLIDYATAVVVKDGGVDKTAEVESIDFLQGRFTFKSSYTPTGSITIDAKYIPLVAIASAKTFTLTQTANAIDQTDLIEAQANGGKRVFNYGLKTVAIELGGFFNITNDNWAALAARSELIIEINPDGNSKSRARGYFKMMQDNLSGDVGALEEEKLSFKLNVPSPSLATGELMTTPFSWLHASDTTLSTGVVKVLNAFFASTLLDVQYLPSGAVGDSPETGQEGEAVVTDVSLSGGLESMNEFSFSFQGSGATTPV